jgi:hypothetical protein
VGQLQPASGRAPGFVFIIFIIPLLSRPRLLYAFIIESSLLLILAAYHFIYCWSNDPAAYSILHPICRFEQDLGQTL